MISAATRLSLSMAAITAACCFGLPGPSPTHAQDGNAANGKRVYLADGCFLCHGRAGQGGALNYPAPPLAALEMPVESFTAFLREAPNDMPAYSAGVLSDQEAADIHAYLRTLPGRKPVKDVPLLNQ
jgi:mono/diheme cytochrome c family protein